MSEAASSETPGDKPAEPGKGAAPSTPPPAPKVELSIEEYQRLTDAVATLADVQRQHQEALEAKERERIKALTDKGEIEKAIEKLNQANAEKLAAESKRYADLEREVFDEKRASVIAKALAGRTFVSDAAAQQVQAILSGSVEIHRDASGKLTEVDKLTRRPASEVLKETLDSPAFAHFFVATNPSGGAGQQGNRSQQRPSDGPAPGSLEAIAAEWKSQQQQYGAMGLYPVNK